jgi:hypothetical protein
MVKTSNQKLYNFLMEKVKKNKKKRTIKGKLKKKHQNPRRLQSKRR